MGWYKEGKVNVVAGQTNVTGVGTNFAANTLTGDAFIGPDGQWYEVINAPSPTTLSISPAYRSATVSNANYAVMPVQGYQRDLAIVAGDIIRQWGATLAGLGTVSTENVVPVAKGGTGGTTAALARAGLELKSASIADLVGIITLAAGVPSGAVFQRGSNASGEFIRFADGTQICWHTATANFAVSTGPASGLYYASYGWTYPAQFVGTPVPRGISNSPGALTLELAPTTGTTAASIGIASIVSLAARNFTMTLFAIGRWY